MNILITGNEGFIGKHLYNLLSKDHTVIGYDIIDLYCHDITKKINVSREIDLIINLAAISRINQCELNPALAYKTNCVGLVNVFEFAKTQNANVIHFSTSCCNGNIYNNHYSMSKHLSEEICRQYDKNGIKTIIIRPANVYGDGHKNTLMSNIEEHIIKQTELKISKVDSIRDYVNVDDVCGITKYISENFDKVYNHSRLIDIGTGQGTKISEIINMYGITDFSYITNDYNEMVYSVSRLDSLREINSKIPQPRLQEYINSFKLRVK